MTTHLLKQACLVNGRWIASAKNTISVRNPANGSTIGSVPHLNSSDVLEAIDAAHGAFPKWSGTSSGHRASLLEAWHREILLHEQELARIITLENDTRWPLGTDSLLILF